MTLNLCANRFLHKHNHANHLPPLRPRPPPRCAQPSPHLARACTQLIVPLHARRPFDTDMAGAAYAPWSTGTLENVKPQCSGMYYPIVPKQPHKVSAEEQSKYKTELTRIPGAPSTDPHPRGHCTFSFELDLAPHCRNKALNNSDLTACEKQHKVHSILEVVASFTEYGLFPGACSRVTLRDALYALHCTACAARVRLLTLLLVHACMQMWMQKRPKHRPVPENTRSRRAAWTSRTSLQS